METTVFKEKTLPQYSQYSKFHLTQIPPYFSSQSSGNLEEIYERREFVILNITCSTALTHRESNTATRFNQLAAEVEEDCMMVSFSSQIALHPSYQEIIGMGKEILPLLIQKLDETPIFWFLALEAITGINPVPKSHRGYVPKMVKDWKKWANENNYGR